MNPPRPYFRNGSFGAKVGLLIAFAWISGGTVPIAFAKDSDPYAKPHEQMVREAVINTGITNPRVVDSMRTTPRHEFVPRAMKERAYEDTSLAIGGEQTISSPSVVAAMTEALDPQPTDRVLEIGTGSGYQAAVLSPLVADVYTIEIVESLGRTAASTLSRLKLANVHPRIGDGFAGWTEAAPFDKIIVTCSPESVPKPLVEQLKEGGVMLIPIGERYQQNLMTFKKTDGKLVEAGMRPTLFVPMTGEAESRRETVPDLTKVDLANPSFEEPLNEGKFLPGWYYQRGATRVESADAPDGAAFLHLETDSRDQAAMSLQGLGLDGRHIHEVNLSVTLRTKGAIPGTKPGEGVGVVLSLYDHGRREIGSLALGPFRGDTAWKKETIRSRIPAETREAILKIGLFGSTGVLEADAVELTPLGKGGQPASR